MACRPLAHSNSHAFGRMRRRTAADSLTGRRPEVCEVCLRTWYRYACSGRRCVVIELFEWPQSLDPDPEPHIECLIRGMILTLNHDRLFLSDNSRMYWRSYKIE